MRQVRSIDPRRTALLLIDLQEEQREDPDYAVESFSDVLGNARKLIDAARANAVRVIHAAYKRDFRIVGPRPFEPKSPNGKPSFSDAASPLTDICREVAPCCGETVILKNDASAFSEGRLEPLLRYAAAEWLVVAGVWTEACVAATVRDAMARGLRVLLVKDACGSGTAAMHQTGILDLANRLYGGAVATTEAACRLIAGAEAEIWVAKRPAPFLYRYGDAETLYEAL